MKNIGIVVKPIFIISSMILPILTLNAQVQKGADIDGEAVGDQSGWAVSMPDANTVAIGGIWNDNAVGHVRVFIWNGTVWVQKGVDIEGEGTGFSGWSVSMPDANTVAIGAPYNGGSSYDGGHVRVYSWNGSAWLQKGVDIDGEHENDHSGFSVSMPDANTVAIGAPDNDDGRGHVRVYSWNGSAWLQKGVDIDGERKGDHSGFSVSMPDANTIAIGAPENYDSLFSGHVRVYYWSGTAWVQKGVDIDGQTQSEGSGWAVSMPDANTIAIGAPGHNLKCSGLVRVYSWSGATWVQKGVDIEGSILPDGLGCSVSMPDANTVAIGATSHDYYKGRVRVYNWYNSMWVQKGVSIVGEGYFDHSGYSVSMPDVNTIATGAIFNSGGANEAGHVRVHSFTTTDIYENSTKLIHKIYPNPASSVLYVEVNSEYVGSIYSIIDNTGREMLTGKIQREDTSIDLGNLSSGVYTISIGDEIHQTFQVSRE